MREFVEEVNVDNLSSIDTKYGTTQQNISKMIILRFTLKLSDLIQKASK